MREPGPPNSDGPAEVYIPRTEFLPFFRPDLGEAEISAVSGVLRSGWLTYGAKVREFGQAAASYLGAEHAVPVSSCSAGLFLALKAMGIGPGDEVILPPITFVATLSAVMHCGARPVLADIDPETLCLDPVAVEAALSPRTRAVIPVDMAGNPGHIQQIIELARSHGIKVLEDAAHSFGAEAGGQRVGQLADATVFSFYATKCITTGDGGLVTCREAQLAERIESLSNHGLDGNAWQRYADKGRWYYEVVNLGWKMHMGDPAAALGLVQLGRAEEFLKRRTAIATRYQEALADLPGVTVPGQYDCTVHAWHLFILRVDRRIISGGRDRLIADLAANRIGSSVHFIPVHHHPAFATLQEEYAGRLPQAEKYFDEAVSLPLFPAMDAHDIDDVITVVRACVAAGAT